MVCLKNIEVYELIMHANLTERSHAENLASLLESGKISEVQYKHFLQRGLQIIRPADLGLDRLAEYLPEIVIGATEKYIERMNIPYQATSFLAAKSGSHDSDGYIFKIPGKAGGGVKLLTGGERKAGDNVFASTHRILIGREANMVSADNWMANRVQIWDWHFFGDHFMKTDTDLYEDLQKLAKIKDATRQPYHVIVARSKDTFSRLGVLEKYDRKDIAVLDPSNESRVIFLTSQSGYDYLSPTVKESDLVKYVVTGDEFDLHSALLKLRGTYGLDRLLNDGGRQMSNAVRDAGLLAEERITLEPYPGAGIIPNGIESSHPDSLLGKKGLGIDGTELSGAIRMYSHPIGDEQANVYIYPLDDGHISKNYQM